MMVRVVLSIILFRNVLCQSFDPEQAAATLKASLSAQKTEITQQKTKIAEQTAMISGQNTKIAELKTKALEQKTKITEQNEKIEQLDEKITGRTDSIKKCSEIAAAAVTSTVFTRWGRKDCPAGISDLVYAGTVGGSWWGHSGAAVDYLCLPEKPLWDDNKNFKGQYLGFVFGGEYQFLPDSQLQDYSPVCAVCRSSKYSSVLMIPGRNKCYPGWTEAYQGELVTGAFHHNAAAEYVCLDNDPQKTGFADDENGVLMHSVRFKCGSLPCPPFEDDKLVTCVVCLK